VFLPSCTIGTACACSLLFRCYKEVPANVAAPAAAAVVPPAGARLRLPMVLARNREAEERYASGRSSGTARPLDREDLLNLGDQFLVLQEVLHGDVEACSGHRQR